MKTRALGLAIWLVYKAGWWRGYLGAKRKRR